MWWGTYAKEIEKLVGQASIEALIWAKLAYKAEVEAAAPAPFACTVNTAAKL